jgi:hypothetical protein
VSAELQVQKVVQRRIRNLEEELKVWRSNEEARRYIDFCQIIGDAINTFMLINRLDELYRSLVFQGRCQYNESLNESIGDLYWQWVGLGRKIERLHERYCVHDRHEELAEQFKVCYREACGIVIPDEKFFASDKLVDLRDQALDEFAGGETLEYGQR